MAVADSRQADPEVQAGRALRRLRLARNWSQEEVAVRMTAYGYDFHQTTIAKIEAAQRPLRVRELADLAALYGVEVQDLVYPPTRSLPEIEQEITDVTTRLGRAQARATEARQHLEVARETMRDAEAAYQVSAGDVAVLEGRLASLSTDREKVLKWESDQGSPSLTGSDGTEQNATESVATSTSIAGAGPPVLRVFLGTHLRRLREASGIVRADAAGAIGVSPSKLARLEAGRAGLKDREVTELLTLYGVTDEQIQQAMRRLAREANKPGWWHDYSAMVPSWFEVYIGLEQAAADIWVYDARSVPDLLQTEDYSRAVTLRGGGAVSTREIEQGRRLRTARREKIVDQSNPAHLRVVLDEAVLRRPVGSSAMMRDQIRYLIQVAELPNMTVQVLPFQAGVDSAEGSFRILRFADPYLHDVVYLEQLTSSLYIEKPEEVNIYWKVMRRLSAQALTSEQTILLLQTLL